MKPENIKYEQIHFVRSSHTGLDSLILEVWTSEKVHVASMLFYDDRWQVMLSTSDKDIRLNWSDFVEIFRQFSLFMADESMRLLKDKDITLQEFLESLPPDPTEHSHKAADE